MWSLLRLIKRMGHDNSNESVPTVIIHESISDSQHVEALNGRRSDSGVGSKSRGLGFRV